MTNRRNPTVLALIAAAGVAGLIGCSTHRDPGVAGVPPDTTYAYQLAPAERGRVTGIEALGTESRTSGAGAVIGGVVGGVLGNQIGKGDGRTAATAAGAIGGAIAGNSIEKRRNEAAAPAYRVTVALDNGEVRAYDEAQIGDLRVGDRVRLDGGWLRRY